jgi:hypothetical protein
MQAGGKKTMTNSCLLAPALADAPNPAHDLLSEYLIELLNHHFTIQTVTARLRALHEWRAFAMTDDADEMYAFLGKSPDPEERKGRFVAIRAFTRWLALHGHIKCDWTARADLGRVFGGDKMTGAAPSRPAEAGSTPETTQDTATARALLAMPDALRRLKAAARGGSCAITATLANCCGRSYDALDFSVSIHHRDRCEILALIIHEDLASAVAQVCAAEEKFYAEHQGQAEEVKGNE